ncbi:hypothetical protein FQR65_LT20117 [Abscondita terminalis]|nr:hypothetical protein FQR65_LT20117 [Abscondita terminalis]
MPCYQTSTSALHAGADDFDKERPGNAGTVVNAHPAGRRQSGEPVGGQRHAKQAGLRCNGCFPWRRSARLIGTPKLRTRADGLQYASHGRLRSQPANSWQRTLAEPADPLPDANCHARNVNAANKPAWTTIWPNVSSRGIARPTSTLGLRSRPSLTGLGGRPQTLDHLAIVRRSRNLVQFTLMPWDPHTGAASFQLNQIRGVGIGRLTQPFENSVKAQPNSPLQNSAIAPSSPALLAELVAGKASTQPCSLCHPQLPTAQGYCDFQGYFQRTQAVMQYYSKSQWKGVGTRNLPGQRGSELIVMPMQALPQQRRRKVLVRLPIPALDPAVKPGWRQPATLSVRRASQLVAGTPPPPWRLKAKIPRIPKPSDHSSEQPNCAVMYSKGRLRWTVLELARQHKPWWLFSARNLRQNFSYDGAVHLCTASLAAGPAVPDLQRPVRSPTEWLVSARAEVAISGPSSMPRAISRAIISGQYAPVPPKRAQPNTRSRPRWAATSSINDLVLPAGSPAGATANRAWELLNAIPGRSCVKPHGGARLYAFPENRSESLPIHNDEKIRARTYCSRKKLLVVQAPPSIGHGPTISASSPCHASTDLEQSDQSHRRFLRTYRQ